PERHRRSGPCQLRSGYVPLVHVPTAARRLRGHAGPDELRSEIQQLMPMASAAHILLGFLARRPKSLARSDHNRGAAAFGARESALAVLLPPPAPAGCGGDGTPPACRNAAGQQVPLYNIDEVDPDSGLFPDAEVNAIRAELVDKGCLTKLGNPPLI